MPTLAQLKSTCAAYHQKSDADLNVNGVDLFLDAVNDVRRSAELLHNFEASRVRATLVLNGASGGNLGDATIVTPGFSGQGIKEVVGVSTSTVEGYDFPLNFARKDVAAGQQKVMNDLDWNSYLERYPSDASVAWYRGRPSVVQSGMSLFVYPVSASTPPAPFTLFIEGYALLADYTQDTLEDGAYTDYFLTYGREWLKWAVVCELNYRFQTFVPRNEGVLTPPEQKMTDAWRKFLLWDTYLVDPNTNNG